ncbi:DUF4167 domain-containing protein [Mycoplana dimorpha]|uniref:Uncharacterized protein DUF4167 n=1 Tax=Mycoplana dimorpha TaxID=28320 RepID=A0A2T5BCI2_MYCDI|nr:DUF4167 domain-containing protein [Mycoplana dimorpha]PTM96613.1 uncharacterized protein DUF4167 [Mycoplana dimorpha]
MRPGQQNKRGRGRNNNNNNNNNNFRKGGNPLTRTYDSSGPDVKIRGTAQTIAEKYAALARDAQSSGDRVMAENYLQHAEHYNRIILSAQQQMQERHQQHDRGDLNDRDGNDRDGFDRDQDDMDFNGEEASAPAPAPVRTPAPAPVQAREPRTHEPREQEPRKQEPAPVVNDGTGPQPVIEGTPAEVSLEEEEAAAPSRQPARRRAAPRQRRPRRTEGQPADESSSEAGDGPVLEAAGSE